MKKDDWIKIEDKLPENDLHVLAYSHGKILTAQYDFSDQKGETLIEDYNGDGHDRMIEIEVQFWMPLVYPY